MIINKQLLYTHSVGATALLVARLQAAGLSLYYFPTLDFAPPENLLALEQAFACLSQQRCLVFISPQSVRAFWQQLNQRQLVLRSDLLIAAVGQSSKEAIQQAGWQQEVYFPSEDYSSEALLALPLFQTVAGMPIGIVRGEGGLQHIDEALTTRGAILTPFIVYQRVLPEVDPTVCRELIQANQIQATLVMSFESLHNLMLLVGEKASEQLKMIPLIVPSERIKKLAVALGFQTIWVTPKASADLIIDQLKTNGDKC